MVARVESTSFLTGHSKMECNEDQASAMTGRYILIVEDDYLIATEMAVSVEAMGAHILGPAAGSRRARYRRGSPPS